MDTIQRAENFQRTKKFSGTLFHQGVPDLRNLSNDVEMSLLPCSPLETNPGTEEAVKHCRCCWHF